MEGRGRRQPHLHSRLIAHLSGDVHQGASIHSVRRGEDAVTLTFRDRPSMRFDEVVFACHGDQVLPLLADPSDRERDVFSGFTTTTNVAWLHTDGSMLPAQARARASWNYRLAGDPDAPPTVTYDLNRLQGLTTPEQYCVTLNPDGGIDERRVLRRFVYRHPLYTARGDPRAAAVARGERRQSHALLRRLLALRVSRGRVELGAQGGPRARSRVVIDSGLFVGTLRHRRFTPVAHAFTYPLFMALLDIDRVPELMRVSRLTSYNRWNWAASTIAIISAIRRRPLRERLADRRGAPRDRSAGRSHLPADAPAVSRLLLQPGLVLLLLRSRGAVAGRPGRGEQHRRRNPQLLAAARFGITDVPRRRNEIALRVAVHAGRPGVRVRLHAAGGPPGRAHEDGQGAARCASTRRCRSNDGPGARRRSAGRSSAIPR